MMSGTNIPNVYSGFYYVSENGTGTGFIPSDPMSPAAFLLIILALGDQVFFLEGDEF